MISAGVELHTIKVFYKIAETFIFKVKMDWNGFVHMYVYVDNMFLLDKNTRPKNNLLIIYMIGSMMDFHKITYIYGI